ncbi:TPA: hypothetical protein JA346_08455 [Legionella pneumophila]|uniref:Uncharacterized protein n=1 Tax=Legionella pneumophila TaxID=446 RepID=A0A2S6EZB8_LEGPN|nr:hypothetical protein [Legionella pneumophila]APF03050.1 hypothetical protein BIZ52_06630 [Legionella pneumophila subsp. fraseri]APF06080.1 hypothetical protein BIZ51_06745 [Legionella pneumophila subsp. fraseri]KXB25364.1 hypothetical protein PtVF89_09625 [Legionella pneumophila]KXB26168.1 hypothetical protein PtVF66_06755 [Legionella pneumophila]KZX34457.1 hypothetical protein PtVFX2014_05515 [Legionella pneumophila]
MPKFKPTIKELRLIALASRGLVQTINKEFIKSASASNDIRLEAINEAIKIAISSASDVSNEGADKRLKIVVMLCNLKWEDHHRNQHIVNNAFKQAVETNNRELVIALCNLVAPASQPSQKMVNEALLREAEKAIKTNNWKFVIAFCNLTAPARQPSQKIINTILDAALSNAESYENKGAIQSSSKAWEAVKAIASLQPPAIVPDKNLSDNALRQLAKVPQVRADKKLINFAKNGEWVKVLNYFIQQQGDKPSHTAMNNVLTSAVSDPDNQWEVFKALCSLHQPDSKTAGNLLQIVAGKGRLEVVQMLCNLDDKNVPNIYYVKNALQVAKNAGYPEITRYLSFEMIRQSLATKDNLALTQAIFQDYVNHAFVGSSLFSSQVRSVKTLLSQLKRTAAQENGEDARNQVFIETIERLKAIMGDNQDLISRVDYIDSHCSKKAHGLDSSLVAKL